jgi:hypothetical protein
MMLSQTDQNAVGTLAEGLPQLFPMAQRPPPHHTPLALDLKDTLNSHRPLAQILKKRLRHYTGFAPCLKKRL